MKYKTTLYIDRPILKVLKKNRTLYSFHFKYIKRDKVDDLGKFYVYEYVGYALNTEEIIELMSIIDGNLYLSPFVSINEPMG